MTVIVLDLVQRHGLEMLGMAVLVGGVIQFLAGVFKMGQWFRAVSPAVVQGMLAGIGVLILSSQFHVMVDDKPKGNGIENLMTIPEAIEKGLPMPQMRSPEDMQARSRFLREFGAIHEQQVQIRESVGEHTTSTTADESLEGLIDRQKSLLVRLGTLQLDLEERTAVNGKFDENGKMREAVTAATQVGQTALAALEAGDAGQMRDTQSTAQASLESVLASFKDHTWAAKVGMLTILIFVVWQVGVPAKMKLIPAPLVAVLGATAMAAVFQLPVLYVEVPDNLWTEVHFPTLAMLKSAPLGELLKIGAIIAVVASAETLLCATAVDQMHQGPRTRYDRELVAQGIGNTICGFLGALPMTGVIVRSAANVEAGGKTRLSTILHGFWLLFFVAVLASQLRMIPTAGLAAMLVYTGYKLINFKAIKKLWEIDKGEVAIYMATVVMIVTTDLLTGVISGIVLSAIKLLVRFSHLEIDLDIIEEERKTVLFLKGAATFVRLPALARWNVSPAMPSYTWISNTSTTSTTRVSTC